MQDIAVNQGLLFWQLKNVFVGSEIRTNAKFNVNCPTRNFVELDIWIPDYSVGFEFQDSYHYISTWYHHNPQSHVQQRDNIKHSLVLREGVTLIDVPCWWDGSFDRLVATLHFHRPDLFSVVASGPIPLNPGLEFFPPTHIPNVGELMLASFPPDMHFLENFTWWMGEKYDGIRCCWNPINKKIYTRHANEVSLSDSFVGILPRIFLDGEFWFGRGQYHLTYALTKSFVSEFQWDKLRLISFDSPSQNMQSKPFEERYAHLLKNTPSYNPLVIVVMRILCKDQHHLKSFAQCVIDEMGEGVILQKKGGKYEHGRTLSLLKLKMAQWDLEGRVVRILGKSIELELPNSQKFTVPAQNVQIPTLLSVGDIVTFSYETNAKRSVPINPVIFRVRTDLSWEDIVRTYSGDKRFLNQYSRLQELTVVQKSKPTQKREKFLTRKFCEKYASEHSFDPNNPENWFSHFSAKMASIKGANSKKLKRQVVRLKRKYIASLKINFPEVNLNIRQSKSWRNAADRRKFFEQFAAANGFDPLIPENWYSRTQKIWTSGVGTGVVMYHDYSVAQALLDLFPNIGLEKSKFRTKSAWENESNRRRFFEEYAKARGFDPHIATNWYSQSTNKLLTFKRASRVLRYYGYSLPTALTGLFPNIGIDKQKFVVQ